MVEFRRGRARGWAFYGGNSGCASSSQDGYSMQAFVTVASALCEPDLSPKTRGYISVATGGLGQRRSHSRHEGYHSSTALN